MERRNTIQRELVLQTVRRLKSHVAADEIYQLISKEHPSIGRGTVYRNLNILADEGEIRRVKIPGDAERFDHTTAFHYHGKCVGCGTVFDVDMDPPEGLKEKIRDGHGAQILDYDIVFRGICSKCQEN